VRDALRLAFGTLTILPVRPPSTVDRRTAGRAMVLAPLVGMSLGLVVVAALWAVGGGSLLTFPPHGSLTYLAGAHDAAPRISPWSPMVSAVAVVAVIAVLTRAMHLDGLADVADGLGSGKRGGDAVAVMRRSDLGPFGVVTLVLVLFFQVMACVDLVQSLPGLAGIVVALVLSRLVLPVLCLSGIPAARPEGLGAAVAGSVSRRALVLAVGLSLLCVLVVIVLTGVVEPVALGGLDGLTAASSFHNPVRHVVGVVVAPAVVTGLFARHCVRRFGGVSGDVLGACVELTFTTCLIVLAAV
jgi:adenosylcobinamide-GDP ribazoletransferase